MTKPGMPKKTRYKYRKDGTMLSRDRPVFKQPNQHVKSPLGSAIKPKGMEEWLTVTELAKYCDRDPSRIRKRARKAEKEDPSVFPIAKRVKNGSRYDRLYSPRQAKEAKAIFDNIGRPNA